MQQETVLIVEDNRPDANLAIVYLEEFAGSDMRCESVASLSAAVARIVRGGVDAVLLDLGLPDSNGLATLQGVLAVAPSLPIVVLTGTDEPLGTQAIQEGAQDYLMKGSLDCDVLGRSLRYAITRNQKQIRQVGIQAKNMNEVAPGGDMALTASQRRTISERFQQLTQRQREILQLMLDGDDPKRIANKLDRITSRDGDETIKAGTVRNQIRIIREKVRVKSNAQLIRLATLAGFSDGP